LALGGITAANQESEETKSTRRESRKDAGIHKILLLVKATPPKMTISGKMSIFNLLNLPKMAESSLNFCHKYFLERRQGVWERGDDGTGLYLLELA
jgi:hypothetical protein